MEYEHECDKKQGHNEGQQPLKAGDAGTNIPTKLSLMCAKFSLSNTKLKKEKNIFLIITNVVKKLATLYFGKCLCPKMFYLHFPPLKKSFLESLILVG